MTATAARSFAIDLVTRAATVFNLNAVEAEPDGWVLQHSDHPPVVGPLSLAELVFYMLEDFIVVEELQLFDDTITPGPRQVLAELMMDAIVRDAGCRE